MTVEEVLEIQNTEYLIGDTYMTGIEIADIVNTRWYVSVLEMIKTEDILVRANDVETFAKAEEAWKEFCQTHSVSTIEDILDIENECWRNSSFPQTCEIEQAA